MTHVFHDHGHCAILLKSNNLAVQHFILHIWEASHYGIEKVNNNTYKPLDQRGGEQSAVNAIHKNVKINTALYSYNFDHKGVY